MTDANNCTSISNSETFIETGLLDLGSSIALNIYPNPFKEETTVDFGQIISNATITIVDVYGKVIEIHDLVDVDKYIISGSNKASGVYFMKIDLKKQYLNAIKLIIE